LLVLSQFVVVLMLVIDAKTTTDPAGIGGRIPSAARILPSIQRLPIHPLARSVKRRTVCRGAIAKT